MNSLATQILHSILVFVVILCGTVNAASGSPFEANCPVTVGVPSPDQEWKDVFKFGGDVLSVQLYVDGWWHGYGAERNYRNRLIWTSAGYDGLEDAVPMLSVKGRQLDADANSANIVKVTNALDLEGNWSFLTVIEFPNAGCWEITGEYGGQRLTFVVLVGDHIHAEASNT